MLVACFDIGGTGVKSALIGADKQVRQKKEIPTPKHLEGLLDFIKETVSQDAEIAAISLSFPGAIDQETGQIQGLSAVPYIHGFSWYETLSSYGLPIFLENDANCVGLSQLAVDETVENMLCVVCGTGIGGAMIVNRQLIRGPKSYGGEFGYMLIAGLGHPIQNWSQLASTGSLVRRVAAHPETAGQTWSGRTIFEAAAAGNMVCQEAIDSMVTNMAVGILNLYYCFDPQVVYIGGGISQNPDFVVLLQKRLERLVQDELGYPEVPRVEACYHHQDANLVGAYMNALAGG